MIQFCARDIQDNFTLHRSIREAKVSRFVLDQTKLAELFKCVSTYVASEEDVPRTGIEIQLAQPRTRERENRTLLYVLTRVQNQTKLVQNMVSSHFCKISLEERKRAFIPLRITFARCVGIWWITGVATLIVSRPRVQKKRGFCYLCNRFLNSNQDLPRPKSEVRGTRLSYEINHSHHQRPRCFWSALIFSILNPWWVIISQWNLRKCQGWPKSTFI